VVNLLGGDLVGLHMMVLGSPRAVAARTQFWRADGVLDKVGWVLLAVSSFWIIEVGLKCRVKSKVVWLKVPKLDG
jgi:hypothetical protein